jgi:uncharacterized protein YdgA (DUF945 family)
MLATLTKEQMAAQLLAHVRLLLQNCEPYKVDKAEFERNKHSDTFRATLDFPDGGYLMITLNNKIKPVCAVGSVETSASTLKTNPTTAQFNTDREGWTPDPLFEEHA